MRLRRYAEASCRRTTPRVVLAAAARAAEAGARERGGARGARAESCTGMGEIAAPRDLAGLDAIEDVTVCAARSDGADQGAGGGGGGGERGGAGSSAAAAAAEAEEEDDEQEYRVSKLQQRIEQLERFQREIEKKLDAGVRISPTWRSSSSRRAADQPVARRGGTCSRGRRRHDGLLMPLQRTHASTRVRDGEAGGLQKKEEDKSFSICGAAEHRRRCSPRRATSRTHHEGHVTPSLSSRGARRACAQGGGGGMLDFDYMDSPQAASLGLLLHLGSALKRRPTSSSARLAAQEAAAARERQGGLKRRTPSSTASSAGRGGDQVR